MLNMSAIAADKRKQLLADARKAAIVTCDMVARGFALGVPDSLMWAAAGAGLADYHHRAGLVIDIRAELKGEKIPTDYIRGYEAEQLNRALMGEER